MLGHLRHRGLCAAAATVLFLTLCPAVAVAAQKPVEKARQLIEEAEFEQALKVINDALVQPDNSDAILVSLYELQATAYLFQGKKDKARQAFERLLQAEPDHELPKGTSPKIRALFDEVRAAQKPVKVIHERIATAQSGKRLDVRARFEELPAGAKPRLYYRRAGSENYNSTPFLIEGSDSVAKVPAYELPAETGEYGLEYYLEVGDAAGRRVAGMGDALAPLRVRVSGEEPKGQPDPTPPAAAPSEAWYQKWWVWTIVGVVVVGAGVGAGVALAGQSDAKVPVTIKVQQ